MWQFEQNPPTFKIKVKILKTKLFEAIPLLGSTDRLHTRVRTITNVACSSNMQVLFVFTFVCFCLCVWVSLVNGVDCDVIEPQINPSSWLLDVSSSRLTRRCRRCSSVLLWQYYIFDHCNVCDQSVTSVTWMCEWWSVFPTTADHHVQYAICSRSAQSQEIERQQQ